MARNNVTIRERQGTKNWPFNYPLADPLVPPLDWGIHTVPAGSERPRWLRASRFRNVHNCPGDEYVAAHVVLPIVFAAF
jgi:hypothetical protein